MTNTIGYVYKKAARKELPIAEAVDEEERNRRKNLVRFLQLKGEEEYARDHRNGYCPHCHMLIPTGRTHCECEDNE